jgi:hypothetical protein
MPYAEKKEKRHEMFFTNGEDVASSVHGMVK